jgi:hypothetical protein
VAVASISKASLVGILATFAAIITPSPLFPALTSITGNKYYVILVFLVGALMYKNIIKSNFVLFCAITIIFFQLLVTIYWEEPKLIILPFYFLSGLLLAAAMQPTEIKKYVKYSSNILLLLLIGGAIGFIYTYFFNGEPLLYINNEDTRSNGLYLTTFSNWYVRGVIRPAGIYDEPGALSFIVCFIAATRHFVGAPKKLTWSLLILGLLTLSLAHIIYTILHLAEEFRTKGFRLKIVHWFILIILIIVISISPLSDALNEFVFSRFKVVDGMLQGDNRSALIINAYNYMSWPVFFFGLDADCIVKPAICASKGYLQFGDNPLGALVLGGIFQFLPYYSVLIILFVIAIKKRSFIILGAMLLLLQRIEVMSFGYSLLILIFLLVTLKRKIYINWIEPKKRSFILNIASLTRL